MNSKEVLGASCYPLACVALASYGRFEDQVCPLNHPGVVHVHYTMPNSFAELCLLQADLFENSVPLSAMRSFSELL